LYDDTVRQVYDLDTQEEAAHYFGESVTVEGTLQDKTIRVSTIRKLIRSASRQASELLHSRCEISLAARMTCKLSERPKARFFSSSGRQTGDPTARGNWSSSNWLLSATIPWRS
jgi:hypothetical protein